MGSILGTHLVSGGYSFALTNHGGSALPFLATPSIDLWTRLKQVGREKKKRVSVSLIK